MLAQITAKNVGILSLRQETMEWQCISCTVRKVDLNVNKKTPNVANTC